MTIFSPRTGALTVLPIYHIYTPVLLLDTLKDGAYYCYCAYDLCISRYSGFLRVGATNTGIFLRGLKLCGESRTQQALLVSKKKIRGNHAFFRDNKASIWKKKTKKKRHTLLCILLILRILLA